MNLHERINITFGSFLAAGVQVGSLIESFLIVRCDATERIYQRTERALSGCVWRANRRVPWPVGCSVCGNLATVAPEQVSILHPNNARARGAQGETLRGYKHGQWPGESADWATVAASAAVLRVWQLWDLPTAPRLGDPKLLYQPSKRGTSQVTSQRESDQHTSNLNSLSRCPFLC